MATLDTAALQPVRTLAPRGASWLIGLLLVSAQLLPSLPQFVGIASSQAFGVALVAMLTLVTCVMLDLFTRRTTLCSACLLSPGAIVLAVVIVAGVILHAAIADLTLEIDFERLAASLAPLVLTILAGMTFARVLVEGSPSSVDRAIRFSFWVLIFVLTVRSVGINPSAGVSDKAMFPFTETSHFALAFAPILMYVCITSDERYKSLWIVFGLLIAVLQLSLSLLASSLLLAVAARRFVRIAFPVIVVGLLVLPAIAFQYFAARLNFGGGESNLSNLGYVLGWEQLYRYLIETSGWGVGFQQFGVHDVHAVTADAIVALTHSQDPIYQVVGFVFAKLASEFGIAGIVLAVMFVILQARCMRGLRAGHADPALTFGRCVVVAFTVDMFFRSPGYFVSSTYIFVVGLCVLHTLSALKKRADSSLRLRPALSAAEQHDQGPVLGTDQTA
jgi:hypothetical protein